MNYYETARGQRFAAAIEGCDPAIITAVLALDDETLTQEAVDRSGLTYAEFAEDVIFCDQSQLWRYRVGDAPLPQFVRRFFEREIVRARHRIAAGELSVLARCPACGRGQEDSRPLLPDVLPPRSD